MYIKGDVGDFNFVSFLYSSYREGPGCALRCNFDGSLKDILFYCKPRQPKKIYFQHVS